MTPALWPVAWLENARTRPKSGGKGAQRTTPSVQAGYPAPPPNSSTATLYFVNFPRYAVVTQPPPTFATVITKADMSPLSPQNVGFSSGVSERNEGLAEFGAVINQK